MVESKAREEDYKIIENIASGGFGEVFRV